MLRSLFVAGILLSSLNSLAEMSATFSGVVRCSASFSEENFDRGSISELKIKDITLEKKGYNEWELKAPTTITNSGGYNVTLTNLGLSATRMNPQDMHLSFIARLSKKSNQVEKVLAVGSYLENDSNSLLVLDSTEEEQAIVDSGIKDSKELIKAKLLPNNYVSLVSVECFIK